MPQIVWPWGYGVLENPDPTAIAPSPNQQTSSLFSLPTLETGEFSNLFTYTQSVPKATVDAQRLQSSTKTAIDQSNGPAWYDIPGRISAGASALNEAFQSTLLKLIILVTIVGLIAVFGLSFVQAKGAQIAKTS